MSRRKLIMLLLAVVVGGITYMGFKASTPSSTNAPAPVETTQVLAAARDLPTGTILKEMDMKWIPWAESADNPKLYFKGKAEMGSLVGAVMREGLRADEPLLAGRVVQSREQGFLAAVLTPGMRAVSVTLTPSAGVAGFIFPGDHVDIILTHSFPTKGDKNDGSTTERRLSETLIRDVRVLALDQKSDNQTTDPKVAQLATLEVTAKQAEKLVLAADMVSQSSGSHGAISLVLRSLASEDPSAQPSIAETNQDPTLDSDVSPVYSRLMQMNKVEVMRGKDRSETVFQKQK
jgi:pilus assembly protein CpaB